MRYLITILTLILSLSLFAGETTGHFMTPFASVQVFITAHEKISKNEIESVSFRSGVRAVGNIESLRFRGQYITLKDIRSVIVK